MSQPAYKKDTFTDPTFISNLPANTFQLPKEVVEAAIPNNSSFAIYYSGNRKGIKIAPVTDEIYNNTPPVLTYTISDDNNTLTPSTNVTGANIPTPINLDASTITPTIVEGDRNPDDQAIGVDNKKNSGGRRRNRKHGGTAHGKRRGSKKATRKLRK